MENWIFYYSFYGAGKNSMHAAVKRMLEKYKCQSSQDYLNAISRTFDSKPGMGCKKSTDPKGSPSFT